MKCDEMGLKLSVLHYMLRGSTVFLKVRKVDKSRGNDWGAKNENMDELQYAW